MSNSYPHRALNGTSPAPITFEAPEGDWAYVSPAQVLDAAHVAAFPPGGPLCIEAAQAHEFLASWCRSWPVPSIGDVLEYGDTHYRATTREARHAVASALLEVLLDASTGCYVVR